MYLFTDSFRCLPRSCILIAFGEEELPNQQRCRDILSHSLQITNPNITTTFITSETIDSDEDMSYGLIARMTSCLAPIDQLQEAADAEMAVEETFNPVDSSNAANRTGLKSSLSSKNEHKYVKQMAGEPSVVGVIQS